MEKNIILSVEANHSQMIVHALRNKGIPVFIEKGRLCIVLEKTFGCEGFTVAGWNEVKSFAAWCVQSDKVLRVSTTGEAICHVELSVNQMIALTSDSTPATLMDPLLCSIQMAAERTDQIRKNEKCIIQQLELLEEDRRKMRDMEAQLLAKSVEVGQLRDQLNSQELENSYLRSELRNAEAVLRLEYPDRVGYPIDHEGQLQAVLNKMLHDARTNGR